MIDWDAVQRALERFMNGDDCYADQQLLEEAYDLDASKYCKLFDTAKLAWVKSK